MYKRAHKTASTARDSEFFTSSLERTSAFLAAFSVLTPDAIHRGLAFGCYHVPSKQQAANQIAATRNYTFANLLLVSITLAPYVLVAPKRFPETFQ
jgi:hypothetical protein